MKKPLSVYIFGALFFLIFIMQISIDIWVLKSQRFIITNRYNFYVIIAVAIVGLVSSILLLVSQKLDKKAFYGILIITGICFLMNIIGKIVNWDMGTNIVLNIIVIVICSFNKNFRKYFKINKKN